MERLRCSLALPEPVGAVRPGCSRSQPAPFFIRVARITLPETGQPIPGLDLPDPDASAGDGDGDVDLASTDADMAVADPGNPAKNSADRRGPGPGAGSAPVDEVAGVDIERRTRLAPSSLERAVRARPDR